MPRDEGREEPSAPDRWDRVAKVLAAEPRRRIIISLLNVPDERRLPVLEAASSPNYSATGTDLELELHHYHLPMMEEAGFVRWDSDRSYVQRGPNFDEVGTVMELMLESVRRFPERMIDGCDLLEKRVQ